MRILALLPDDGLRVLTRSLGGAHDVVAERDAEAAARALRDRTCDALVLDPAQPGDADFEHLLGAVASSRVPVLLFTALHPGTAHRIVRMAEHAAPELVLRGREHASALLLRKLAALVPPSVPALLLSRAAPNIARFPDALQETSVTLFGGDKLPRFVGEFAAESGMARRSVDRWMQRAGISGASMLLDAARLARVWEPLVERESSPAATAEECGYTRYRLFVSHVRRIVDVTPAALRFMYTRETFADRLAKALLAP